MAWQDGAISGVPGSWIEVDPVSYAQVTANQKWSKDAIDQQYFYDATSVRFPGTVTNAILFYNLTWSDVLPAAAVVQSITANMDKFLLGGLFLDNDLRDGALVPTKPSQAGGTTPKPHDRNYSFGTTWQAGLVGGQPSAYPLYSRVEVAERLDNTEIQQPGFGFLYYMISETGKMESLNGGAGIAISDPRVDLTYIVEV